MMFHRHTWTVTAARKMERGTAWTADDKMSPCTVVLYVCGKCGKNKTERLDAWWELSELLERNGA